MSGHETLVAIGSESKQSEGQRMQECMAKMRRRLVVVSGTGGVGKSTAAVNLGGCLFDTDSQSPTEQTCVALVGRLHGAAGLWASQ